MVVGEEGIKLKKLFVYSSPYLEASSRRSCRNSTCRAHHCTNSAWVHRRTRKAVVKHGHALQLSPIDGATTSGTSAKRRSMSAYSQ